MKNKYRKTSEIPFYQGGYNQYLAWIISLLTFIFLSINIGAYLLKGKMQDWSNIGYNKFTIQVPYTNLNNLQDKTNNINLENSLNFPSKDPYFLKEILLIIHNTPNIIRFDVIKGEEIKSLLSSWIGQTDYLEETDLPILIDVEIKNDTELHIPQLTDQLRKINAGIKIEMHATWTGALLTIFQSLKIIITFIILFIIIIFIIIISFITKSSLIAHKEIINTLRLLGARRSYIAKQFNKQAFYLSLKGGLGGIGMALIMLFFFMWLIKYLGFSEFTSNLINAKIYLVIFSLPFFISAVIVFVSHIVILKNLNRIELHEGKN